ncbi:MAG: aldo/keto reductase, partial [Candidatus Dormibacter sp.]
WHQNVFEAVNAFVQVARDAGLKPATLAIAWVLSNPAITAPIIGASRADQLDDTLAALDVTLDEPVLSKLDELTRVFRQGDAPR